MATSNGAIGGGVAQAARYGVHLPVLGVPLNASRDLFVELSERGYTDFWSAEADTTDGIVPLALTSSWVPTARLGTAILPVYTRGPALLAMTAATLADAAPGRFALGIGASSKPMVQGWNGISFVEPYKHTRDVVRFLRQAFAGERVDAAFDTFTVRGFRLGLLPEVPPAILVAALRPGMLRMASREADGVILNWLSADDLRDTVRPQVDPGKEIVCKVFVSTNPDLERLRTEARRMIAAYLNVEVYAAYQRWLGREKLLTPMWEAWAAGDRRGALAAIPDEVVDQLIVHGTPEQCRAGIQRYADAGATTVVVVGFGWGDCAEDVMRAVAPGR
ncbi:LLM class F420-dependent oxidoreductase [Frankia sp. Cppng1_Ct_nod]|uniref:LLM class F420-dependent oxidoreductase n=1 Tax=Frankia sp. Cppng1_Ct_nod TaxID=2897162 RepID=UPI001A93DABB|nr:LLM class F420-dependent oxidoreductase [Frankia sp. Cppng1_Ct_nod]